MLWVRSYPDQNKSLYFLWFPKKLRSASENRRSSVSLCSDLTLCFLTTLLLCLALQMTSLPFLSFRQMSFPLLILLRPYLTWILLPHWCRGGHCPVCLEYHTLRHINLWTRYGHLLLVMLEVELPRDLVSLRAILSKEPSCMTVQAHLSHFK